MIVLHHWVVMIVNGFLTEIVNFTALVTFSTGDLSGCFVLDSEHFRHPPCAALSVTSSPDDGHNRQPSNSYCSAQFACDAAVIPNQRFNFVFVSLLSLSRLVCRYET